MSSSRRGPPSRPVPGRSGAGRRNPAAARPPPRGSPTSARRQRRLLVPGRRRGASPGAPAQLGSARSGRGEPGAAASGQAASGQPRSGRQALRGAAGVWGPGRRLHLPSPPRPAPPSAPIPLPPARRAPERRGSPQGRSSPQGCPPGPARPAERLGGRWGLAWTKGAFTCALPAGEEEGEGREKRHRSPPLTPVTGNLLLTPSPCPAAPCGLVAPPARQRAVLNPAANASKPHFKKNKIFFFRYHHLVPFFLC